MNLSGPDQENLLIDAYWECVRSDFSHFFRKSFETISPGVEYLHNWHVDLIKEYLEACKKGQIHRLIVNIPPRHLKSSVITAAWPAWLLARNPAERIMCASYAKSLSMKHSMESRLIVESEWYKYLFPDTIITSDQNEKSKFITTARGQRVATSVGATTTGDGGSWLLCDDPLNAVDAQSEAVREAANSWFDQAYSTRLDDKKRGVMIVVMQRLHEDDLTGHLLAKNNWEHLKIPAETPIAIHYKINDFEKIFKRGEALHPARMDKKMLTAERVALGEQGYSAQYLQEPVAAGGNIVKEDWFRIYDNPKDPYIHFVLQSYDTAFTEKTHNDPTACLTWGVIETKKGMAMLLLDAWTDRLEYPGLRLRMIEEFHYQYGVNKKKVDLVLIEDKGSGISLLQDLRQAGLPVRGYNPGRADKISRLHLVSPLIEAGFVWLPGTNKKPDDWCQELLRQVRSFPNGKHDDLVDCLSGACLYIRDMDFLKLETVDEEEETLYTDEAEMENPYAV